MTNADDRELLDERAGTERIAGSPEETSAIDVARRRKIEALKQELTGGLLLTAAEVAEILDVHPRTVGEYIREGKLKAFQFGGGWKIAERALRAFVAVQTREPSPYGCSFCGQPNDAVERLIAGSSGIFICNRCVARCNAILRDARAATPA